MYRAMRPGCCWRETGAVPFPEQTTTSCSGNCSGKGGSHEEVSRGCKRTSRRYRSWPKASIRAGRLHRRGRGTVEMGVQSALGRAGATQADHARRTASPAGAGAGVSGSQCARGLRGLRLRVRDCLVVPGSGGRCLGSGAEHGGTGAGQPSEDRSSRRRQVGSGPRARAVKRGTCSDANRACPPATTRCRHAA